MCEQDGTAALPVGVLNQGPMATTVGARVDGWGGMRRIVLTQGLMKRLTRPQILAVVAHELGHARLHHLSAYYAVCGGLVLAGVTMGGSLVAHSVSNPVVVLALLYLCHELVSWPVRPVLASLRRRYEYQADGFAIRYAGAAVLASALRALLAMNPHRAGMHPWYRCFYATHPDDSHRLAMIDAGAVLGRRPSTV